MAHREHKYPVTVTWTGNAGTVTVRAGDDVELAQRLHHQAHEQCFIANSLNFPVRCEASIRTE